MQERQWGRRSCMQTQVHPPGLTLQHNARQVVRTQVMHANTSLLAWAHSAVKLKESHEYAVHVCKLRCTRQGRRCSTTQGKLWVRNLCMQTQVYPPGHILLLNWRKATSTRITHANTFIPACAHTATKKGERVVRGQCLHIHFHFRPFRQAVAKHLSRSTMCPVNAGESDK